MKLGKETRGFCKAFGTIAGILATLTGGATMQHYWMMESDPLVVFIFCFLLFLSLAPFGFLTETS